VSDVTWRRDDDAGSGRAEVNLTPLIDVSLVLVVMLLLATPLAFESGFAVRGVDPTARRAPESPPVPRLELCIVSEDSVRVNRDLVARSELGRRLSPLLSGSGPCQVTVDCADGVSHGTFVEVLDVAKLEGAGTIAVVGR
jgi:biopolymer transport protein ExbD